VVARGPDHRPRPIEGHLRRTFSRRNGLRRPIVAANLGPLDDVVVVVDKTNLLDDNLGPKF
jgi:hypothetical protein